jgi:hypothetical protein
MVAGWPRWRVKAALCSVAQNSVGNHFASHRVDQGQKMRAAVIAEHRGLGGDFKLHVLDSRRMQ